MSENRPTSINVIAYFFIVTGSLSIFSGLAYIAVRFSEGLPLNESWAVFVQVSIASSVVVN